MSEKVDRGINVQVFKEILQLVDEFRKTAGHQTIEKLAQDRNIEQVQKAVQNIEAVRAKAKTKNQKRKFNKALNKYDAKKIKLDLKDGNTLQKFYQDWIAQHPDFKTINYRQWRDLLALDDWATIAKTALPYIMEYGPKAISALWNKYLSRKEPISEVGLITQQTDVPKLNLNDCQLLIDGVFVEYVAGLIAPETESAQRSTKFPTQTAEYAWENNYNAVTNGLGNFGAVIFGDGISGLNVDQHMYLQLYESANFVPATGIDSLATLIGGPMQGASFTVARMNDFSVEFIPSLSSFNNQGLVQMILVQQQISTPIASGTATQPAIAQATMSSYPYYQECAIGSADGLRQSYVPSSIDESAILPITPNFNFYTSSLVGQSNTYNKFVYILVTGAPANSNVGTILVSQNGEFVPGPTLIGVVTPSSPESAPMTDTCCGLIFQKWNHISQLKKADAVRLADQLRGSLPKVASLSAVMNVMQQLMGSHPPKVKSFVKQQMKQMSMLELE